MSAESSITLKGREDEVASAIQDRSAYALITAILTIDRVKLSRDTTGSSV